MKYRLEQVTEEISGAYTFYSTPFQIGNIGADSFSVAAQIDVDTPDAVVVASADIDFAENLWDAPAHGLSEGMKVRLTTSDTLPDPLLVATDYFVIVVDADSFMLAATLADAIAGTPITLVDAGVGDQTVTPSALAGGTIKLQQTNTPPAEDIWFDLGSATNITVDANLYLEKDRPTCLWIRVAITLTAGHISATLHQLAKGDKDV